MAERRPRFLQGHDENFFEWASGDLLVNVGRVLRAKMEYQMLRPLFVRLVGQYIADQTDSLRDDSRTNAPILIESPAGTFTRTTPSANNLFHVDVLRA